jgi:hypothetical protein
MTEKMMTISAPNGGKLINIGNSDLSRTVYRTFSLARFEALLAAKSNGLASPAKWDDPFENFFLANTLLKGNGGELGDMQSLAKDWYGQCWTFNDESDAIWRIYSPNKDGIKVAVRLGDLLDDLAKSVVQPSLQAFAGRVLYWTENEISSHMSNQNFTTLTMGGQNDCFAELLCIKREAFKHEEELRLLFCDIKSNIGQNGVYSYPFNVNTRLSEAVIDPRLSQQEADTLVNALNNKGLTVPTQRSTLYDAPRFTIPLQ